MTLQEYISNKVLEKASVETLKAIIRSDSSIPLAAKRLWLQQIEQYSKAKEVIDLLTILFPQNQR